MAGETSKSRVMESLELGKDSEFRPLCLVQGNKIQPLPSGAYCRGRDISLGAGQRNMAETPSYGTNSKCSRAQRRETHLAGNQGGFLEERAGNLARVKRLPICCCPHIPSFFVPPCLCTYCSFPGPPSPSLPG